jgi:hypothetical protein
MRLRSHQHQASALITSGQRGRVGGRMGRGAHGGLNRHEPHTHTQDPAAAAEHGSLAAIPVVVNGPVGLPPPRSADVAPVPLVAVVL